MSLSNFYRHTRFYLTLTSLLAIPFISGAFYGLGEAWARIVMGRMGYLPRVLTRTGKPVENLPGEMFKNWKSTGNVGNILSEVSID